MWIKESIIAGVLLLGLLFVFLIGVFVGANRVFPYNILRGMSDKISPYNPVLRDKGKIGVVIFGDSLSARGKWDRVRRSSDYELLVVARGGLRASDFPYDSDNYTGEIHVYWLGTNDLLRDNDIVGAMVAMRTLTTKSARAGREVIVIGLPIPMGLEAFRVEVFQQYNRELKELSEQKSWTYVGMNEVLNLQYPDRNEISSDGVHLNLEASDFIAGELLKVLGKVIND